MAIPKLKKTESIPYSEVEAFYNEAVVFVEKEKRASTSALQREFKIGYARAARILDLLEARGVISATNGAKPRTLIPLGSRKPPTTEPNKPEKQSVGRPTDYTQELADELCAQLATGKSLRTVCEAEGMPAVVTIFGWFRKHDEFLKQYARAKEESADALADEILDIADDGRNDWMSVFYGDTEVRKVDQEAVQRSKLRVDTRKWIASKLKPKKYGDKVDVTSDGDKITGNTFIVKDFSDGTATGDK